MKNISSNTYTTLMPSTELTVTTKKDYSNWEVVSIIFLLLRIIPKKSWDISTRFSIFSYFVYSFFFHKYPACTDVFVSYPKYFQKSKVSIIISVSYSILKSIFWPRARLNAYLRRRCTERFYKMSKRNRNFFGNPLG